MDPGVCQSLRGSSLLTCKGTAKAAKAAKYAKKEKKEKKGKNKEK
jgi:hypothetical protein